MAPGRFAAYLLLFLSSVFALATASPGLFFGVPHESGNVVFFMHDGREIDARALERAASAVGSGYFSGPEMSLEVYATGGRIEYLLLAPFCAGRPACMHPLSGKVFTAPADIVSSAAEVPGEASGVMGSAMIRELVRAGLRSELGLTRYILLPEWKKNGYAEHIAKETADMPASAICGADEEEAPLSGLLEDRLMVEMLAEEDKEPYPLIMEEDHSYDVLRSRLMKKHCPAP